MPKKKKKAEKPMEVIAEKPMKKAFSSQETVQNAPRGARRYRNFDEFWFKISKERNLDGKYRDPLKAHLKAAGYYSPEKYEEGLRHFGL